jgi:SSS family solute:Na+ symporter
LVGVVWHSGLIAAPIFLVIQQFLPMTVALSIVIVTSIYLKINWWNKMEDYPDDMPELSKTEGTVF